MDRHGFRSPVSHDGFGDVAVTPLKPESCPGEEHRSDGIVLREDGLDQLVGGTAGSLEI
jgi:hypothetical protein